MLSRIATVVCITQLFPGLLLAGPATAPANLRELAGQVVPGPGEMRWKYADVHIEWGFTKGSEERAYDGRLECAQSGMTGQARPLPGDGRTAMTGERESKSGGAGRRLRGIVLPVLYTPVARGPQRTILTVLTSAGSFSFQPLDLEDGPILRTGNGRK